MPYRRGRRRGRPRARCQALSEGPAAGGPPPAPRYTISCVQRLVLCLQHMSKAQEAPLRVTFPWDRYRSMFRTLGGMVRGFFETLLLNLSLVVQNALSISRTNITIWVLIYIYIYIYGAPIPANRYIYYLVSLPAYLSICSSRCWL